MTPGGPTMVAVPSRKTDITAEWLTEALTEPFPGIKVTNMTLLDELHGSAAKMRIELTTEGATEPPRTVVVKTAFTEGLGDDELARSWISVMALLNETECTFYRDISAALGTRCPRYYYGSAQGENSFIVMEDLTWRPGLRFGSFDKPLSPDDMADVLDVLAQVHSLRWDDEKLSREPIRDPTLAGGFLDGFLSATNWEQQMARPRAE